MTGRKPSSILFACSSNAIRSPMAEGWLKHFLGQKAYIDSVGVTSGPLDPFAVTVMQEAGLDISRHKAKTFDDLLDTSFDLIITLSPQAHHHALDATRNWTCDIEHWPTPDPSTIEGAREMRLDAYRKVRDLIRDRIQARFGLLGEQKA